MTIQEAKVKADSLMLLAGKFHKDQGRTTYTVKLHTAAAGYAMKKVFEAGLEPTAASYGNLFQHLYNHSAWRQAQVKADNFPKPSDKTVDTEIADLEEEMEGS